MKILVSDFDGTFYFNSFSIDKNIDYINAFMDNKNIFVIATARSYDSIQDSIKQYCIPYDYLICFNGSSIFDKNKELVVNNALNIEELKIINQLIKEYNHSKIVVSHSAYDWHDKNSDIYGFQVSSLNPLALYDLGYYIRGELPHIGLKLEGPFRLRITKNNISKSIGINKINKIINVDNNDIFTIGDDVNDLEMIKDYNGFNMPIHHYKLNRHSLGTYSSVAKLSQDIMDGTARTRK